MRGVFCWKQPNSGIQRADGRGWIPSQTPGIADIIGVLPGGRFLAIEVKRPGGELSPTQKLFLENVNRSGGLAFMASSLEEVIKTLNGKNTYKV
jgi:hypothetical protein